MLVKVLYLTRLKQLKHTLSAHPGLTAYAADFKEIMPIVFDTHLPKWYYRAIPQE
ncbi:hypothetical protein [Bathymodiolus platifrons methanotrophic gill symbiont]|uniref:hypothetical protein n=1 Tax=Bathymodiolus platifrons methanotrophic gill symbiont TaxID=113268 RepID=UPI001E2FF0CF|nr:hypothetical protein [Bathymodiolus platifrons methanotrophic gill symbiont]